MPNLFDPIDLGAIHAANRLLMAPLTRGRAGRDGVPVAMMADYYAQRASAGLIISEATGISRTGLGWPYAPGLWSDEQVEAWTPVTAAVHQAGGRIVADSGDGRDVLEFLPGVDLEDNTYDFTVPVKADLGPGADTVNLGNGLNVINGEGEKATIGDEKATVLCGGIQTANATVYVIDTVMMP